MPAKGTKTTKSKKQSTARKSRGTARKSGAKRVRPTAEQKGPPYQARLGKRGEITIWRVDGSYIRTNMDEEFSDYGHHYTFEFIPKEEFWIDQNTPEETEFFIRHMQTEYRLMEKGVSQDEALEQADAVEAEMRKKAGDVARLTRGGVLPDPQKVHHKLWKKLENGVEVWIVNARLVRSVFDDDFASGGHFHVYEYIPENEVWIDNTLKPAERPFALLHELHERNLMEKGWDYDKAHADSSKLEHHARLHPTDLHEALAAEGWE